MSEATTTEDFRKRLAKHMYDGTALPQATQIAFGDGGHTGLTPKTADPTRTQLYNELLRKPLASLMQEDLFSLTGRGMIEATDLVGVSISEAALLDSEGNMLGFRNFAPKVKDSDETYDIKIKLKF
jgi:hypothetical protein